MYILHIYMYIPKFHDKMNHVIYLSRSCHGFVPISVCHDHVCVSLSHVIIVCVCVSLYHMSSLRVCVSVSHVMIVRVSPSLSRYDRDTRCTNKYAKCAVTQNIVSFIGLFCQKDYNFEEHTHGSHPIVTHYVKCAKCVVTHMCATCRYTHVRDVSLHTCARHTLHIQVWKCVVTHLKVSEFCKVCHQV